MYRSNIPKGALIFVGLLATGALTSGPLLAQSSASGLNRPHIALGWVANAPDMMGGIGGYVMTSYSGLGLYADVKMDLENPSGDDAFEAGLTAADVVNQITGADFVRRELSYKAFNVALAKSLTSDLIVYAGGGLVYLTEYHLYEELSSDLGVAGIFWVEAPALEKTSGNLMIGAFLRMSSFLSTQVGFETEPRGFTIGASLRLPHK